MLGKLITSIVGTSNDRELTRIGKIVSQINALEPAMRARTDAQLRGLTDQYKERLANGETLDDVLVEAFATAREGSVRALQMRPFDVQVVVGIILHEGKIAEQKTGEGKTLAATMPIYLNALTGRGVHLVTVNDYLAKRDAEWMGKLYTFLGMSVGSIYHDLDDIPRRLAYHSDITYGTNNEFGFDYLRDNLKHTSEELVQREFAYAIVDEVDSILIDEARTPLIISGPVPESTEDYQGVNIVVKFLKRNEHFVIDEKARTALLTEDGVNRLEEKLQLENLYDPENSNALHMVENLLKAYALYHRDKDYIVKGREVVLVDEFTGRLMPGRRLSEGLHQAIEAKENVPVHAQSQTYASISFQNYFRMYEKLSGMTGTAETEAVEFKQIYGLDAAVIPTNKPMIRIDHPDQIYKDIHEKVAAIVEDIQDCYDRGQPVLVGTTSIERSEAFSKVLKGKAIEDMFLLPEQLVEDEPEITYDDEGNPIALPPKKKKKKKKKGPSRWAPFNIPHNVLNARNHTAEANIIAQAGAKGMITLATNMAGRGTDIQLGGNPEAMALEEVGANGTARQYLKAFETAKRLCDEQKQKVLELGGLRIIGTERHESRRIDNQLRGRAGRQGDPGSSCFYLSLDDDLLRIFGQDKLKNIFSIVKVPEGEPLIAHSMADKLIERAQKQVEAHNFDIRKHLIKYDDVMNRQREVIYEIRHEILMEGDLSERTQDMISEVAQQTALQYTDDNHPELWPFKDLQEALLNGYGIGFSYEDEDRFLSLTPETLADDVETAFKKAYQIKSQSLGDSIMRHAESYFLLNTLDSVWMNHLWAMDHLRDAVRFSGYAQRDPLMEYKKEAFRLFEEVMWKISEDTVRMLMRFELKQSDESAFDKRKKQKKTQENKESSEGIGVLGQRQSQRPPDESRKQQPFRRTTKVGSNDPCPCGSGKKFKKCCRDKEKPV